MNNNFSQSFFSPNIHPHLFLLLTILPSFLRKGGKKGRRKCKKRENKRIGYKRNVGGFLMLF
jgi:hypothetical protein